ncbi:WhiB family redox-sensing transcriptional regulator [Arcanobacterium pluranimalium]|nr:WhiB family redox-sensing transcriptional regulator [Arcanobacterium pluranimalium]
MLHDASDSRKRTADSAGLDAQVAQSLMQGIFNLGYGTSGLADLSWMEDALCAQTDPDIFYPEKGGSTAPATSVCNSCSVRAECLDYAVTNDIRHGIWGGTSDNDRKRMSRERKIARGGSR